MPLENLGPYQIERIIGRGGMGAVYSGVHQDTGERVAIKVLSLVLASDQNLQDRFVSEIETLRKLKHENIVQLSGFGEEDGYLFYVMDLVDGRSLQEHLDERRRFPWKEVANFTIQICDALKHAHDRGVIHRDLKPANLLLAQDGETLKLTDFGIAKLFGGHQITAIGGIVGTADYMAPEQADGGVASIRTDLYSLGSVMYALLYGKPPFAAPTISKSLERLRYEDPRPILTLVDDLPEELGELIMQLLAKDPSERVATARAVANRIKAMLHALDRIEEESGHASVTSLSDIQDRATIADAVPPSDTSERSTVVVPEDQVRSGKAKDEELDFETDATHLKGENRYVTVDESQLDRLDYDDQDQNLWIKILIAIAVFAAVIGPIYYFLQPESETALLARIEAIADSEDGDLLDAQASIDEFLKRFPDSESAAQVEAWKKQLELDRYRRRLERLARRNGGDSQLTPVQRAYLDALRIGPANPHAALLKMQGIVNLFESLPEATRDDRRVVDLAKMQLKQLGQKIEEQADVTKVILKERISKARSLLNSDRHQAMAICRGIVELYRNQPWADEWVTQANEILTTN